MDIHVPDTQTIVLSDAQKFIEICRQAAKECNMSGISYNKLGMFMGMEFADGSKFGSGYWMKACGWLTDESFK